MTAFYQIQPTIVGPMLKALPLPGELPNEKDLDEAIDGAFKDGDDDPDGGHL